MTRTLKQTRVKYRAVEEEDLAYYYAAYLKGALAKLDPMLSGPSEDIKATDFDRMIADVLGKRDMVATYFAEDPHGRMVPAGFVGLLNPLQIPWLVVSEMIWFPWAGPRAKLANALNFVNDLRDEVTIQAFADIRPKETSLDGVGSQAFYTHLCKYGVMRRVGQMHDFYGPGRNAAVFQSKRRKT